VGCAGSAKVIALLFVVLLPAEIAVAGELLPPSCTEATINVGGGIMKFVWSGSSSLVDSAIDVLFGFNGLTAKLESSASPGALSPEFTELPFTFASVKIDALAELVGFAVPSDPVELRLPDVANPNSVLLDRTDGTDTATAAGTEVCGVAMERFIAAPALKLA
jgi:hypothetical protein